VHALDWWSHPTDPRWWASALAIFLLSASVAWASIRYAQRRNLIDQPGRRRSHDQPTPRGGGIGIVVAVLAAIGLSIWQLSMAGVFQSALTLGLALVLVAAVGWIDDHRGVSVRTRLLIQALAVAILLVPIVLHFVTRDPAEPMHWGQIILGLGGVGFGLLWSINLHNFMDGINGLLACQAIFVFLCLAALLAGSPQSWQFLLLVAAVAGFLPFNFPRARIFMGDVGSAALGLLIGVAVLTLSIPLLLAGLIACSAFVTDATCTLLSRMGARRRWYSAHREHLYQWLARSGFSHASVVGLYMGWNFIVVVPVLYLANRAAGEVATGAFGWLIAVYALAVSVWFTGKRWCLQHARKKNVA
jgi:UDP-N-acetylmuramyl pentapeptide phosphotransferase/UDP-N-acetylglucosamine-1-phosphate transferase